MKYLLTCLTLASFVQLSAGATITGFGTSAELGASAFAVSPGDTNLTYVANPFNLNVTGSDFGGFLSGTFTGVNVAGLSTIQLTANVSGTNPSSNFSIRLFNPDFSQSRSYVGNLLSFGTNTTTTVNLVFLSQTAAFDTISGFEFTGNGIGSSINVTFDTLAAVPEPSTYALLGLGLAGLVLVSRRQASRA